ncbi:unnamed protein product [Linum tenue]|uniref:Uncharacterized protein n=1 Tax=Linum tenue TaxID=586396 RepID=A0AAV0JQ30_9ROSI|nr:unnamed protein product [Linum tenue]
MDQEWKLVNYYCCQRSSAESINSIFHQPSISYSALATGGE